MTNPFQGEPILFEAEDETRFYEWQLGHVALDPAAGTITIHGHSRQDIKITISASEIAGCEIVKREDISKLGQTVFVWVVRDETGAVGCPLALLLGPVALIDAILAKRARFPAIKLTQATNGDAKQGWVIHLRSRKRRRRGRTETMAMAHRVVASLRQSGYSGPLPELTSKGSEAMIDTEREHDD
jgi:hypothetical protein